MSTREKNWNVLEMFVRVGFCKNVSENARDMGRKKIFSNSVTSFVEFMNVCKMLKGIFRCNPIKEIHVGTRSGTGSPVRR